jgi:hypothetical protein
MTSFAGEGCTASLEGPTLLEPIMPLHYEKKSLPLWRFVLEPNFEGERTAQVDDGP